MPMMDSYRKHIHIPEPTTNIPPELLVPTLDDESVWTAGDTTDRVVTKNYSSRVVVCTPHIPYTYRTIPAFVHYELQDRDTHPEYLTAVLDGIEAHLNPTDPFLCRYGIKFGDDQIMSNTTDRLVEDVTHLQRHLTGLPVPDGGRTDTDGPLVDPLDIKVAAIWPVDAGWFYMEGGVTLDRDRFVWSYGLLYPGHPIDTTHIRAFFTECAGRVPPLGEVWPERHLYATDMIDPGPLTNLKVIDAELVDEIVHFSGTNPFYTGPRGRDPEEYADLPNDLYHPLRQTSTLLYTYCRTPRPETPYIAEEIIAVEPPTHHSLFVRARANLAV
jgi:hypothetical protein